MRTLAFVFIGAITILANLTHTGAKYVDKLLNPHSLNQTVKCQAIDNDCDSELAELNSGLIRLAAVKAVINSLETPADFLFGPSLESYRRNIPSQFGPVYPHNLLFNALLISGVVGLILVLSVYFMILLMACRIKSYFEDRVLFLGGLSLMAQIINSMFHNDSLNHGSIYPWLIAAFILGRSLERSVKSSMSSNIFSCPAQ